MKSLPSGMQDFLDGGETTMVHAWKVTRTDGLVQGFTEHDNDLVFDSVIYKASSGFSATRIESSLGLSADNLDAEGALSDETLNADDLSAGRYDDAEVELWWVNFDDVSQRILLNKGNIGKVNRGEFAFTAELRSMSSRLQQATGRIFQRTCDATLGDSRCKVDLTNFTSTGLITSVNGRTFEVDSLSNDIQDFYALGVFKFTSGLNAGLRFEIKSHDPGFITLWEKPPFDINIGETFEVIAGCDKFISTCANKFSNTDNFQGFNLIPGNDFLARSTKRDSTQQGGSIFK